MQGEESDVAFWLVFVAGPLLLGLVLGWFQRGPVFGVRLTLGSIGGAAAVALAGKIAIDRSEGLDGIGVLILAISGVFAFGVMGLVGIGAIAGAWLRRLAAG